MTPRRCRAAALSLMLLGSVVGTPSAADGDSRKKAKKAKAYDYENSKFKAYGALTSPEPKTYRFDAQGNPIPPGGKKKPKKKAASEEPAEEAPVAENCDAGESCSADGAKSE